MKSLAALMVAMLLLFPGPAALAVDYALVVRPIAGEYFEAQVVEVGGKVLATKRFPIPVGAVSGTGQITARGSQTVATIGEWGTSFLRQGCKMTIKLAGGLNWAFWGAVLVAYATPAVARAVLPVTTARLEDFRTDCQQVHDYVKKALVDGCAKT